jgi:hypothetical protein
MFDPGDCALGNVRIDRDLRRRRDGDGNRDAGDGGNVGNVNVVGNISDIGNVDNLRNDGNVGIVGNVRFRFEQHCFIVNANVAHNSGRRCSNRNSVGIHRDRQSWGQLRGGRTDNDRIAHCGYRGTHSVGTNHADDCISLRGFVFYDKPIPVPNWRHRRNVKHCGRLLK